MLWSAFEIPLALCRAIILADWAIEFDTDIVTWRSSDASDVANDRCTAQVVFDDLTYAICRHGFVCCKE